MDLRSGWRGLAAVGASTLALVLALAALLAPGAPASRALAASTHSCGSHAVSVAIQEPNQSVRHLKLQVKNVKASGLSCSSAFKFLDALYKNNQMGPPEKFKCRTGRAKEPAGYFQQICTRGSRKIEYGAPGG